MFKLVDNEAEHKTNRTVCTVQVKMRFGMYIQLDTRRFKLKQFETFLTVLT